MATFATNLEDAFVYVFVRLCKYILQAVRLYSQAVFNSNVKSCFGETCEQFENLRSMHDLCIVHELANDTEWQQLLSRLVIVIGVI